MFWNKTMKAYVIHHSDCHDREPVVQALVHATDATVVDAVWFSDRSRRYEGNSRSHVKVAQQAEDEYLVFEDDCVLADDWRSVLQGKDDFDVIFLGVNSDAGVPFGTHALVIRQRARLAIIEDTERLSHAVWQTWAFDHILNLICKQRGLRVWVPDEANWQRWALQKKGMLSTITGVPRR
jgi:hypothetical protein